MSEENKNVVEQEEKQKEGYLDFGKLFKDIWKHRALYYKVLPVTFVLSAILLLSIPNYYKCEVMLAPELSRSGSGNSLASLASSFGLRLGSGSSGDALFPMLYPNLMNNVDFNVSLFSVPVTIEGNKEKGEPDCTMSYYDYLKKEQKYPWWSAAIGTTKRFVFSLFRDKKPQKSFEVDPFRLTQEQMNIVKLIHQKVDCKVDPKTQVITIRVIDQDPFICATMADTVKNRLQAFITDYRTSKARVDLEYSRKLYRETKARYEKARQRYAEFADANQDLILQTVRQRQTDLENEMQLQYNAYNQVAGQMMVAEARVQEETPAFTTLQGATVPVDKAGPARAKWCVLFLILAFMGTTAYIFYKEDDIRPLIGLS